MKSFLVSILKIFVVESLSRVWPFAAPWTAAHQAPPSSALSQSLLKFLPIKLVMPSNHLILCQTQSRNCKQHEWTFP